MPVEVEQGLLPSILDRLIDPESAGTAILIGYDANGMRDSVRRDLEDLLNTRQTHAGMPEGYQELNRSVLAYGLPDVLTLEAITGKQREEIGEKIRRIIELFEPRLRDVTVRYLPGENAAQRSIRFHIDARLCVDPAPEVAFDTVLELTSGQYAVNNA
jgi:type VI secretion system protein ImpF